MTRLSNGCRFPMPRPSLVNVRRLDYGALPLIEEMNRTGILIDAAHFARLDQDLAAAEAELGARIDAAAGRPLNPESGDQVAALLFDELGLGHPAMRLTPTGARYSTEEDVLAGLRGQHPLVDMILGHRELVKLRTTYVQAIPLLAWPDGRVRTTFKATTARTGRLSSENPNLQNIPILGDWGKRVRRGFVARNGCKLVSSDLGQIEMRVAAHESRDPRLMQVFWDKLDIHTVTAIALFKLVADEIQALLQAERDGTASEAQAMALKEFRHKYRLPAKTLGFQILYGVTAKGLQLAILAVEGPLFTLEECQSYIDAWFDLYSVVRERLEVFYGWARRYGLVWDQFGRHRWVPEIYSAHRRVQAEGLRQAGNHPMQAGAQGIIKTAMFELRALMAYYRSYPSEICDPLLQIHDEILFECSDAIAGDFAQDSRAVMASCVPLEMPVEASADVADTWGDLK